MLLTNSLELRPALLALVSDAVPSPNALQNEFTIHMMALYSMFQSVRQKLAMY